ncbi:MAG: hypothetical protein Q9188_005965 [Gyalolechia gomerana]
MFSYLRSNNRRSAVPSASIPYSSSTGQVHSLHGSTEDFAFKHAYHTLESQSPSPISPDPPILPPIPRVASQHEPERDRNVGGQTTQEISIHVTDEGRKEGEAQASQSSTYGEGQTPKNFEDEQRGTNSKSTVIALQKVPLQQNSQTQNRRLQPLHATSGSMPSSRSELFSKSMGRETQSKLKGGVEVAHAPPPSQLKVSSGPSASAAPGRQGKARFNLPNLRHPMSLLARRRSHQAVAEANNEKAQYKGAYPPVPRLPEDFDPRIRGSVVHDFSAPRPGTKSSNSVRDSDRFQREAILYNSRKTSPNPSTAYIDDESPSSGEREHTPQFKEHFDDDLGPLKDGPAKRRTSAFMYQVSLSESQPEPDAAVLPPFARHLPSNITTTASAAPKASCPPSKKSLEVVPETSTTDAIPTDKSLPSTPLTSPAVKPRSRASSNADSPYQPAGLPKHFKSNASRFSFDLAGVGSAAQEKLLEEKHRQNERRKARMSDDSQRSEAGAAEDEDEYLDEYNDLDEDDGLEERIPGVNADAEETSMLEAQQHIQGIDFVSPNKSSFTSAPSLTSTGLTSPNTPRDSLGQPINLAGAQIPPNPAHTQDNDVLNSNPKDMSSSLEGGSDYVDYGSGMRPGPNETSLLGKEDDDLYFDDGVIEDLEVQEDHPFDESVFDDDTSRVYGVPLRDQKLSDLSADVLQQQQQPGSTADAVADSPMNASLQPRNSFMGLGETDVRSSFSRPRGLANLAAYHDALAVKVNQAALNGEFARRSSVSTVPEGALAIDDVPSQAAMPSDCVEGRQAGGLLINGSIEDRDDLDFDDALADDSIIAAANAEALENDDEGFYGQEFGFFARASGSGEGEYVNGGYFGSREFEGIVRSHSGRINEPSLTPITERSEWSNRNSAISLAMHGFQPPPAGPQPSPGLAQLADMMHLEEDDMSLSMLMKLRRGAWGGSNASLHSSSSGSPLTYVPAVGFPTAIPMQHSNSSNGNVNFANNSPLTTLNGQNFASSSYSLNSSNGFGSSNDSSPSPNSATVTLSSQQQALPISQAPQSAPAFLPQQQQLQQSIPVLSPPFVNLPQQPQRRSLSPVKRSSMGPPPKPSKGHSRNSSNTSESVSYVLEAAGEDGGQGRWVLEKRRVDESGMVEVFGREVVEGGRI